MFACSLTLKPCVNRAASVYNCWNHQGHISNKILYRLHGCRHLVYSFIQINTTLMKLELIQTKENGAKENSQREEKVSLSCRRFQRLPGVVPVSTRSHFSVTLIKYQFSYICYFKTYDKRVNTQVKRDLKL